MSFRIIYGRSGSGKSEYIFKEIKQKIADNNKIYIITPEQFSFTAEKKLMQTIGTEAVFNAEILTLNRMAYRVMNEVGGAKKINISNSGKAMLIYSILTNQKSNLKFLGKSSENIELISRQITELKKHGVTVQDFEKACVETEDKYLKAKMNDIITIYRDFEKVICDKYIDENDVLKILSNQLDETKMFENSIIYIDEFSGFTKQEYQIIAKLMKVAKQVTISICADNLDLTTYPETDIFYTNKKTISKLLEIAKNENINIENPVQLAKCVRFKNDELLHLEKNLYAVPYNKYEKNIKYIKLFLANNQYSEIENVAQNIVKMVKEEKIRYRDISVITKNLDVYSNLCKVIFDRYQIPVFIDEKKDLSKNIIVRYLLAILEIFARNWSSESVFNYVKTGFLDIEPEEIFKLENYCTKWGIKYSKWYKGDWNFGDETPENKAELDRFKELRKIIVDPLLQFKNELEFSERTSKSNSSENMLKLEGTRKTSKNVKNLTKILYEFLLSNNINNKIQEKIEALKQINEIELAKEYETSWKIIIGVLDELVLVFGDEVVTFEQYMQLLKVGLKNSDLGKIPGTQDQVIIGDVDRSRSHKVKSIFIIGLNDGMFPSINKNEGFLNDLDRDSLKEKGIELAKGTIENLYEENFNIYKAFSTAEESIYLSYASSNSEGKSLRQSTLISKLKKIFPNIEEKSDIINKSTEILLKNTTFEELLNQLRDLRDGKEIDSKWFSIYKIFIEDSNWSDKLKNAIQALEYKNEPENINKENIKNIYGNTLNTSVSRLEQYQMCPFSYYLKYTLNVKEKDNFMVRPIDTGTFMHEVIDEFFEFINSNSLSIKTITDEELEKIVEEIINEKLGLNKNYIFNSTPKYQLLTKRLKRVVKKSIIHIVESIKYSDFEIIGNEIEFKKGKKYPPIKIQLDSGKNVEITGKIDRIDLGEFEANKYIRIVDYKSSIKDIDLDEVYAGVQLQLITYLDAVCDKENVLPAGVLYFNLIDPIIKSNKNLSDEEIKDKIREQFKMRGLILADIDIIKMMDKKLEDGKKSSIVPVALNKDGSISNSKSSCVSATEFKYLQKTTNDIIKQISEEILKGNIDIKPHYNLKKKKTPCEYCEYKSICMKQK